MISNLIAAGFKPISFPDVDGDVYKLEVNVHKLHTAKKLLFAKIELEDSDIATIEVYPDESIFASIWDWNTHEGPFNKYSDPGLSILRDVGVL
jgi:hypothetical protein